MSYEAGSKECRHLIEAKESLLSALDALKQYKFNRFNTNPN